MQGLVHGANSTSYVDVAMHLPDPLRSGMHPATSVLGPRHAAGRVLESDFPYLRSVGGARLAGGYPVLQRWCRNRKVAGSSTLSANRAGRWEELHSAPRIGCWTGCRNELSSRPQGRLTGRLTLDSPTSNTV